MHRRVRANLLELLKIRPDLAENYNQLLGYYWVLFDDVREVSEIGKATPAETITRNLRRLVQCGEVKIPQRVLASRKEKRLEFQHEFKHLV